MRNCCETRADRRALVDMLAAEKRHTSLKDLLALQALLLML